MMFLFPLGLLALLALPVIVILHLIRERRRRVAVPSLLHWLQVPRREEGRRAMRLPLTLLLLLHLLAAGLIALALAAPQLPGLPLQRAEQTALVLDLSTSMAAASGLSTRFDEARERARALVQSMSGSDQVTLVAAGPQAHVVASGGASEAGELLAALDALQPGGVGADLDGALRLAEAALDPDTPGRIVVLTDGATPPVAPRTVSAPVDWQTVGSGQANRAVVAFAARNTGSALQVYARVANYDSSFFASEIRLYRDDQIVDLRGVEVEPESETEQTWTLPAGSADLRVEIDGRDGLPADDHARLAVTSGRPLQVLLVSERPDPLLRAIEAIPNVDVLVLAPQEYSGAVEAHQAADVTVFDRYLPQAWPTGATLAIDPPSDTTLLAVGAGSQPVFGANLVEQGPLLAGIGFGGVSFGSVRQVAPPEWAQVELAARAGTAETGVVQPLVLRGRAGDQAIAIWAFDPSAGNLTTRLAFPLLMARTIRSLAPDSLPQAIQAGEPLYLRPNPRASEVLLIAPDGRTTRQPAVPDLAAASLSQPGWYTIVEQNAGARLFEGRLAVNAGSPIESDLRSQPAPTLLAEALDQADPQGRSVIDLWPWLAAAALLVLVLEWGYVHR